MALNRVHKALLPQISEGYETFTPTYGQTVFTLTNGSYAVGAGQVEVFIGGIKQFSGTNFTETSSKSITLSEPLYEGETVEVAWKELRVPNVNHANTHKIGGTDALSVKDLVDYQTSIADVRVNVKDLGLQPDTGLDISDTLQAIINGNNDRLFFDDGRYIISKPILLRSNLDILMSPNAEIYLKDNSKCRMFDTNKALSYMNITIKGGIFNGNDYGQGAQSVTGLWDFSNSMRFYNVKGLKVTDVFVKEIRGHGIEHWNCDQFLFQNIEFDQGHDEVNRPDGGSRRDGITGGSSNGKFINIHGFTNDDMIALLSGVSWGGVYVNEVANIEVNGIKGVPKYFSAYNKTMKVWCPIRIACADGKYTKNIKVTDISGSFANGIRLGGYDIFRDGFLDDIQISNIHDFDFVPTFAEQGIFYHEKGTCGTLSISDVYTDFNVPYKTNLIYVSDAKIKKLNLRDIDMKFTITPTPIVADGASIFIKDRWGDASYTSIGIEDINFWNVRYSDNNPNDFQFYRKHMALASPDLSFVPLTTLRGSYIPRKTIDVIGGEKTKIAVDSEFINTDYKLLINQKSGYKCTWNDTIFTYLKNGFLPTLPKQSTVSGFYSFTPEENVLFVDVTGATQYYRIQDNTQYKFPIGYTLTIKRVDSNATYNPYIRMTNDVTVDGATQTNLPVGAKITIQYNGTNWRTI